MEEGNTIKDDVEVNPFHEGDSSEESSPRAAYRRPRQREEEWHFGWVINNLEESLTE